MNAGVLAPAVVIAALVVRSAVAELRIPGTARAEWSFACDPVAVTAAVVVSAMTAAVSASWPATAWGLLAAALTGHLTHTAPPGAVANAGASEPERAGWCSSPTSALSFSSADRGSGPAFRRALPTGQPLYGSGPLPGVRSRHARDRRRKYAQPGHRGKRHGVTVRRDRPHTGGEGSPTVWGEEESADLVLQGEEAGALLQALVGSTEWVAGHRTAIPAHERVIRIPFRTVQILREACDAAERASADHRDVR